jgi:hypothetical protein
MVGFHMQIIIKIYISIRFGPDTGTPFMARKLVVLTHTIVLANISCLNFSTSYNCTCKHYEYEFQLIPNVTQDVYFGPLFLIVLTNISCMSFNSYSMLPKMCILVLYFLIQSFLPKKTYS